MIQNDFGAPMTEAWKNRVKLFFKINNASVAYLIFKVLSLIVFTIPFLIFSAVEFIVLSVHKFVGYSLALVFKILHLSLIWIPISFVFGFVYIALTHLFWVLWLLCNLVDVLANKDIAYPFASKS